MKAADVTSAALVVTYLDSKIHGANMVPPGVGRTQVGHMLATWTLLFGWFSQNIPTLAWEC